MKKIKFKINISNDLTKLNNFFSDRLKKFNKFIKFKIIKYITNSYDDAFKKFKKFKFFKISNLSITLIFFITFLFLYLFYLSIPTLYNKETLQRNITDKLIKEFKINFSLSSNMKYLILPSPHVVVENVKIFSDNLKNPKELSQIKKLKIYISQKNLFDQNNLNINKIAIENANFFVDKNTYSYFDNYLKKKFIKKKIVIKNSNFFLRDKNNDTISIFPIKYINLFYNDEELTNEVAGKGKFFKIPFYFKLNRTFGANAKSTTLLMLNKLDLKIENESAIKDKKYLANNNILFRNANLNSNIEIKNNLISFNSKNSKMANSKLKYNGKIYLNPFDLKFDANIEKLNLIKLLTSSFNLIKSSNLNFLLNKNLNIKIILNIGNVRNKIFDNSKILINFDNGKINFNDSYVFSKKIGSIKLYKSKVDIVDENIIFKGSFNFNIENEEKFYTTFQIPKKSRKLLKNIFFDLSINTYDGKLNINNFRINKRENILNHKTQDIIIRYNDSEKNEIQNWISLKNFIREIFITYLG